jgi:hypothetical protein
MARHALRGKRVPLPPAYRGRGLHRAIRTAFLLQAAVWLAVSLLGPSAWRSGDDHPWYVNG